MSDRARVIGRQLRAAREALGLSKEAVAASIRAAETDLEKWESDVEQPDVETLWEMARLYHRSPDYFLKRTAEIPSQVNFRLTGRASLDQLSQETRETIVRFEELCRWHHELESLIGEERTVGIPHLPEARDPATTAARERHRMGLDSRPIADLRALLEGQGLRIFELPVPGGEFAGLSWWNPTYGPCALINASDPVGRRNFTTAHEYAHLLVSRATTVCDLTQDTPDEVFAQRYAAAFLMPESDIRRVAENRGIVGTIPGARELQPLARRYGVSLEAAGRRLEELGLIPRGSTDSRVYEWQSQSLFRRRPRKPTWRRRLGEAYVQTSLEAYGRGAISLGRLSELLDVDVRRAREVYEGEAHEGRPDDGT
jgi:Zn-dependent peptidase ImmA (M78 family)/transcriptional regulator with XRE-family HTH domain